MMPLKEHTVTSGPLVNWLTAPSILSTFDQIFLLSIVFWKWIHKFLYQKTKTKKNM